MQSEEGVSSQGQSKQEGALCFTLFQLFVCQLQSHQLFVEASALRIHLSWATAKVKGPRDQ